MKLKSLVGRHVESTTAETTLRAGARHVAARDVGSLVVIEDGHVKGIITEREVSLEIHGCPHSKRVSVLSAGLSALGGGTALSLRSSAGVGRRFLVSYVPGFRVSTEADADHIVVKVEGELDIAAVAHLESAWPSEPGSRPLYVDLSSLDFIDLAGLDSLLARGAGKMRLISPGRIVQRLIEPTGTTARFEIVDSIEDPVRGPAPRWAWGMPRPEFARC